MIPADQRLEAGDLFARGIDARLIGEVQLALFQRNPQVRFHELPLACGLVHFGREEAVAALAGCLGRIKREIGVAHQII